VYKSFKFRLKPTGEQAQVLTRWAGTARWLWNYYLDLNKQTYGETKKFVFKREMITSLPKLKTEHEWLRDIPSQALQQRCMDLDVAIQRIWKQGNGFPKFKSKHIEHHNSFRITQTNGHIKPTKRQIQIPKLGWVSWIRHRPLEGKLKSITVKQENGFWWCVCLCEMPDVKSTTHALEDQVVGIDLGLTDFAVTSDGEVFDTPKFYRKKQKKLRRKQRQLSRKCKGSKNRDKARKQLNRLHYKIKCQRHDFTHKASSVITKQYRFVTVEDLNVDGMKKNRSLAKSISDQGWAMFVEQLTYKSKMNGGCVVKIGRFKPSSKTCSVCGNIQLMPLDVRVYECTCGLVMDRDVNAAINIKLWGIEMTNRAGTARIYACGDTTDGEKAIDFSSYVSVNQEKFSSILEEKPSVL